MNINPFVPKVMIVDDDELVQSMYEEHFKELGHETVTCGEGASALKIAETFCPDIMIADLKMPGMGGMELMNKMRERFPDIEVIIITGHGKMETSIKSFRNGAVDFLTKPVDSNDMMIAYNNAVKRILLKRSENASPQEARQILQALIKTYNSEKKLMLESMSDKLNTVIYPQIDQLVSITDNRDVRDGLKFIKELLSDAFSLPHSSRLLIDANLSPIEIKICDLIAQWKNPQEISELLNLSIYTVYDHRKRIRKKLGLGKSKESLDKYLRIRMNQDKS